MTAVSALEIWISLTVQVGLLAIATAWIERRSSLQGAADHIWAAFCVVVLILTIVAWIGPHPRYIDPPTIFNTARVDQFLKAEESVAIFVLSLWIGGAVIGLVALAIGIWRSSQFVREAKRVPPSLRHKLLSGASGRESHFHDEVEIRVSSKAVTPFCWQLSRPIVVLPCHLMEFPIELVRSILAHELAHLQAGHPLQLFLQRLVEIVYWHHPLVWMTSRLAEAQREFFADSAAVRSREETSTYLKGLLALLQSQNSLARLPVGLPFAGASTLLQQRAARLAKRDWGASSLKRCQLPLIRIATLTLLCSLTWIPLNLAASTRSTWSPWPEWSAAALNGIGIEVRDYEIDAHRLRAHHHAQAPSENSDSSE